MFATPELAARIDRAEGRLCAGLARAGAALDPASDVFALEVSGGMAVFAGAGSPVNKMIAIGFDAPPDEAEIAQIEGRFASMHAKLQAEVSTLATPETHALLVRRGYEPRGFENQLGHPLLGPDGASIEGVEIRRLQEATSEWCDLMVAGFSTPDTGGVGGDALPPVAEARRSMKLMAAVPGFCAYQAWVQGTPAGAAAVRFDGTIAQMCGAATIPAFRRRGVQTALLRTRLADAAARGCEVAVVTVQPASKSQQNAQRAGFSLLYSRALLVREP